MTDQVKELKNDSLKSFQPIYNQYYSQLYQYVYNRTQSSYLAQEVAQLSFIKLWETRNKLSAELPLNIQLFRIARTTLIDELRKETVKEKHHDELANIPDMIYEENRLSDKDSLKYVYQMLEHLPPVRKKVFKLSRQSGFSHKQIAVILSISPKTVENHITIAVKQLRNSIATLLL